MTQDRHITTSGSLQSIAQVRHLVEGSIVVHGLGEADNAEGSPGWIEGEGSEWVSEDVTEECRLNRALGILAGLFRSSRSLAQDLTSPELGRPKP